MTDTTTFSTQDLDSRSVGSWDEPDGIAPRGTLIVLGGRGENPAVYERFGTRISRDAWRVRAIPDATDDTDTARSTALALLADADLPAPKVLVGSDAGAALAIEIAASSSENLAAVILAGIPTAAGAADGALSTDGELPLDQIEARTACPNHQKVLRREVGASALDRTLPAELLAVAASGVRVPTLAIHGDADVISPVAAALAVYAELPSAEVALVAGGRHDILNDVTHRSVAATVVLFLERVKAAGLTDASAGASVPLIVRPATA